MAQRGRWAGLPASWTDQHVESRFQDYEPLEQHEEVLMDAEIEPPPLQDEDVWPMRWSQELDDASWSAHLAFEVQATGSM